VRERPGGLVVLLALGASLALGSCVAGNPGPAVTIGAGPTWAPTLYPPEPEDYGNPLTGLVAPSLPSVPPGPAAPADLPTTPWPAAALPAALLTPADIPGGWKASAGEPYRDPTPQRIEPTECQARLDAWFAVRKASGPPTAFASTTLTKDGRTITESLMTAPIDQGARIRPMQELVATCSRSVYLTDPAQPLTSILRLIPLPDRPQPAIAVREVLTNGADVLFTSTAWIPAGRNILVVAYEHDKPLKDADFAALTLTAYRKAMTGLATKAQ